MTCDYCRPHEHGARCWDGKPLRSNLICTARVDLCSFHGGTMLVYDVWISDVHVGRFAEKWGESALVKAANVRCQLVTDTAGRLARR